MPEKLISIEGIAAPLPMVNIDTDQIYPKQFLRTIKRTGLGVHLFHDFRFDQHGENIGEFVLNKPAYKGCNILVADENFGIGSSREHAVWALHDFGIRCVIAPSFGDIFYNNAFKNGLLLIRLDKAVVKDLISQLEDNPGTRFSIDIEKQILTNGHQKVHSFDLDSFRKYCLIEGLDDIALTLQDEKNIAAFEKSRADERPWLENLNFEYSGKS